MLATQGRFFPKGRNLFIWKETVSVGNLRSGAGAPRVFEEKPERGRDLFCCSISEILLGSCFPQDLVINSDHSVRCCVNTEQDGDLCPMEYVLKANTYPKGLTMLMLTVIKVAVMTLSLIRSF